MPTTCYVHYLLINVKLQSLASCHGTSYLKKFVDQHTHMCFFSIPCYGTLLWRFAYSPTNAGYSIQMPFIQLCDISFVPAFWRKPLYGYDAQVSIYICPYSVHRRISLIPIRAVTVTPLVLFVLWYFFHLQYWEETSSWKPVSKYHLDSSGPMWLASDFSPNTLKALWC